MSAHSLFSPSAAHRWMACPGSMSFPENRQSGESSVYADDGTASHAFAASALNGYPGDIGDMLLINDREYVLDEERAEFIQVYLDDVRRRAIGGSLFVEYAIDLSNILGKDQGGTADALILLPKEKRIVVEDLKYGTGEKVYASYETDGARHMNPQLGLYLRGAVRDMVLLGHKVETVTGVICQPRLGHIDEHTITWEELAAFGTDASIAADVARDCMANPGAYAAAHLVPGEKQCRWCRAKTRCPALTEFVQQESRSDFDDIEPTTPAPENLARAFMAVPLVRLWCNAVEAEVADQIGKGKEVLGPDGKSYKFVEGREGSRTWSDAKAAEAALTGQLGPKAYCDPKLITAPAAAKLLDKKATKAIWKDVFEPLIKRAPGRPVLALGSDPRPAFSGASTGDDFEDELTQ